MDLFWSAIKQDSVSLLRFRFLNHIQVFLCEISPVDRLKCPHTCFSSHFCFLDIFVRLILVFLILYLLVLVGLPRLFLYSLLVVVFTFFSWYIQRFFVVSDMQALVQHREFSCSLVHLLFFAQNCPEYLTKRTAQVFISLESFHRCSLVSSSFFVTLGYSFLIFSFISVYVMVSASNILKYL